MLHIYLIPQNFVVLSSQSLEIFTQILREELEIAESPKIINKQAKHINMEQ